MVDDSDHHSEDNNQPLVYTKLTKSKNAKLKGVTVSQENNQVGSKGCASENAFKNGRPAKEGMKRRATTVAAIGQPIIPDDGRHEIGAVVGRIVEHDSGPPNIAVGRSGVEDSGEGGGTEYRKRN